MMSHVLCIWDMVALSVVLRLHASAVVFGILL